MTASQRKQLFADGFLANYTLPKLWDSPGRFSGRASVNFSMNKTVHVLETAIAKRLELPDEGVVANCAIARRTLLECKARRHSILQHSIPLLQMFHQTSSDIICLADEYPRAAV